MVTPPRRFVKVVVLAASTLLVLLLAEAVVRVVQPQPLPSQELLRQWILPGMYVEDERAGYRVAPGFADRVQRNRVVTDFVTNSLGLRAAEPDDARRPRVLVLGDSNTWGWGAEQGTEWAAKIEQELQASHPGLQVLNGGVNGYGTVQALGLLEQIGPELKPDLVLLGFSPNDYVDNLAGLDAYDVKDGYLFDVRGQKYWRHQSLLRWSHLLRLINGVADGVGVKWLGGLARGLAGRDFSQDELAKAGELSAALILQTRDRAAELGARFGVVWLPSQSYVVARGRNPIREKLQASVRSAEIPSIDLLGPMRGLADLPRYFIPGDGHYASPAHRLIARHVARFVEAEGLLPEAGALPAEGLSPAGGP